MTSDSDSEEPVGGVSGPQDDEDANILSRCPPKTQDELDVEEADDDQDDDPGIVSQEDV